MITQWAPDSAGASPASDPVIASRMGRSSAVRLAGFEIVRRTTPSAGPSTSSLPSASSLGGAPEDTRGQASRAPAPATPSATDPTVKSRLAPRVEQPEDDVAPVA